MPPVVIHCVDYCFELEGDLLFLIFKWKEKINSMSFSKQTFQNDQSIPVIKKKRKKVP